MTLPGPFGQRAAAVLDGSPDWQVPACRHAATVALLRPAAVGFEVLVQQRHTKMQFAPNMYVFPGGAVEASDAQAAASLTWGRARFRTGKDISGPANQPEPPATETLALAAARETAEEAGIEVAAVDLVPIAHWLTPAVERRRFDTRFFAVAVPEQQAFRDDSGETTVSLWLDPRGALERWQAGQMPMLPPTIAVMRHLAASGSIGEAMDPQRADLRPVLPHPYRAGGEIGWRLIDAYSGEPLAGDPWPMP